MALAVQLPNEPCSTIGEQPDRRSTIFGRTVIVLNWIDLKILSRKSSLSGLVRARWTNINNEPQFIELGLIAK